MNVDDILIKYENDQNHKKKNGRIANKKQCNINNKHIWIQSKV